MNSLSPHDRPDPVELLEALRELLVGDVLPELADRTRFHVRVAVNVLDIVVRELELGPEHARAHAARLGPFGAASDAELALAIRNGDLDDRYEDVVAAVRHAVWDKLAVTNPSYVAPYDSPLTSRELHVQDGTE